jgi:hypothetical protein
MHVLKVWQTGIREAISGLAGKQCRHDRQAFKAGIVGIAVRKYRKQFQA